MINLINNELYKIMHKKSLYIINIFMFFIILINTILCFKNNITNCSELLVLEFSEINLFVVISILIVSGNIVSDEYNKGTIKNLLIRPYKRTKILLSKLISCIIVFIGCMIFYFVCCYLFYGLLGNFNYDVTVYKDVIIRVLYLLPEYLIMLCFSFLVSVIISNSGICISLGFSLFIGSNIVNELILSNDIKYLMWFPTLCWDLNTDVNNLYFNIFVVLITISILLVMAFLIFNKREIRNS